MNLAKVHKCYSSDDEHQQQYKYPTFSGWRGVKLSCGDKVTLHILKFDRRSVALGGTVKLICSAGHAAPLAR
jgi:hypothetical protein